MTATTHDIAVVALTTRQAMRDAFVDLKGLLVTLRTNNAKYAQLDEAGDVTNSGVSFTNSSIKMVVDLSKFYHILASFALKTAESETTPISGLVKLSVVVNKGDRVIIPRIDANVGDVELQVSDVQVGLHYLVHSKEVYLVPVRD